MALFFGVDGLRPGAQLFPYATLFRSIRDAEGGIEALRQRASEAGESLLRLHGEQKQAEEALVHQTEAVRKLETNEHEMLETSMRARDDADRVAHELEAVSEQLGALKQNAAELQAKIGGLREQRDGLTKEADALRDALASVRARHSTLTQILNDRSYTAEAVQKLFAANERGGGQQFRAEEHTSELQSRLHLVCRLLLEKKK